MKRYLLTWICDNSSHGYIGFSISEPVSVTIKEVILSVRSFAPPVVELVLIQT